MTDKNMDAVDVVVRFHDARRTDELSRAVFSLVGQSYRPLHIIVATQRFSEADIAAVRATIAPLIDGEDDIALTVVNWSDPKPADARSVLLNMGVQAARGRYLAFLDYDDVLYPEAYSLLIGQLRATGAAIAFASVRVMSLKVYPRFFYTAERIKPPFSGHNLMDLFRRNFCPIHSYVIDRSQVAPELLAYSTELLMEEDYDVLIRICANHVSNFGLITTEIGDYYYKTDGSNTVSTAATGELSEESAARYHNVRRDIEFRRRTTYLAPAVQKHLGLPPAERPMTVQDLVNRYS